MAVDTVVSVALRPFMMNGSVLQTGKAVTPLQTIAPSEEARHSFVWALGVGRGGGGLYQCLVMTSRIRARPNSTKKHIHGWQHL